MFCSTIIATVGRNSLARAVASVLDQTFSADDFEIIVVNDSGRPLPAAAWQNSGRVRVVTTQQHERCVARNVGAALARGRYFHFLDDDDWLLPGALQNLWQLAAAQPAAGWLYGSTQLVDRHGQALIQLKPAFTGNSFTPLLAGEWIPLQASLISANAFFAVGGFHPLIPGIEDIDLGRRLSLRYNLASTPAVVASVEMGQENSTTNRPVAEQYGQWAREALLNEPGAFARMAGSADTTYWRGRIVRAYLTSVVWNLKRRRFLAAASRALFAAVGLLTAGPRIFSGQFWQAVANRHQSQTFAAGFMVRGELEEHPPQPPAP